jgi:hypothetical protein
MRIVRESSADRVLFIAAASHLLHRVALRAGRIALVGHIDRTQRTR